MLTILDKCVLAGNCVQYLANACNTWQMHTIVGKLLQYLAIARNTWQVHAIFDKFSQYLARPHSVTLCQKGVSPNSMDKLGYY